MDFVRVLHLHSTVPVPVPVVPVLVQSTPIFETLFQDALAALLHLLTPQHPIIHNCNTVP
jgi:hypothetical protein